MYTDAEKCEQHQETPNILEIQANVPDFHCILQQNALEHKVATGSVCFLFCPVCLHSSSVSFVNLYDVNLCTLCNVHYLLFHCCNCIISK